ncbi:MAG TPA: PLD nuclease N-terminal domain-containing protein [Sphingomonadaceae bacterium]
MIKLLFGLIIFALDIWAILNVWRNTRSDGVKIGWAIGILVFPILGFLAWAAVGPKDVKRLPGR